MRRKLLPFILIAVAVLALPPFAFGQQVVFLIRHAEQAPKSDYRGDPPLTEVGRRRAEALAKVLKDAGITVIYGSKFRRTTQTAEPLAKALNIEVKIFPRRDIDGLISRLRMQHALDHVLIVSHSKTVPHLLKAFGHSMNITIARKEYDNLVTIIPKGNGNPLVLRLRYKSELK